MLKKKKIILMLIIVLNLLFVNFINIHSAVSAETIEEIIHRGHKETSVGAGFGEDARTDPIVLRGLYMKYFLSFLGVIFLILIIYAGFLWMKAEGNEEQATKAKQIMVDASIGLAVILAAYVIASYVIDSLITATVVVSS